MNNDNNPIEGQLEIRLQLGVRYNNVLIHSTRPLHAPGLFEGKPVDEVLRLLPLLYSVCGTAQACAAVGACERAQGVPVAAAVRQARELLLMFETAREHIWRILLDWPLLIGGEAVAEPLAELRQKQNEFKQMLFQDAQPFLPGTEVAAPEVASLEKVIGELAALINHRILSRTPEEWSQQKSETELRGWAEETDSAAARMIRMVLHNDWSHLGANQITPLPEISDRELEAELAGAAAECFIATPRYRGRCHETNAYTRVMEHPLLADLRSQYGNGLLPRLVARLVELAQMPARMLRCVESLSKAAIASTRTSQDGGSGTGMAQVEAARGRLVHRVELDAGRVGRYQVLAPTEWNFHPNGVFCQALAGLRSDNEETLRLQAQLMINAIDPCVGYKLEIE